MHQYRPEIIVTIPKFHGVVAQALVEQHLQTRDLAPDERIFGIGLTSPAFLHVRAGFEARQVQTPSAYEHRYIPTVYATTPLAARFESRNRTRVELRDVAGAWSQR